VVIVILTLQATQAKLSVNICHNHIVKCSVNQKKKNHSRWVFCGCSDDGPDPGSSRCAGCMQSLLIQEQR